MARKPRIHCTETDKAVMWDRWRVYMKKRFQPHQACRRNSEPRRGPGCSRGSQPVLVMP